MQNFDMERFTLQKVNVIEGEEWYHVGMLKGIWKT
jgi:hypothetical protein